MSSITLAEEFINEVDLILEDSKSTLIKPSEYLKILENSRYLFINTVNEKAREAANNGFTTFFLTIQEIKDLSYLELLKKDYDVFPPTYGSSLNVFEISLKDITRDILKQRLRNISNS